jgi:carbonic anhydrase/acetyltransferase-like protein (isoleucine patch superfamily)
VELGAVVVVPAREDLTTAIHEVQPHALTLSKNPRPLYSSRMPILGNDVLRSWMERVRKVGVQSLWLTSSPGDEDVARPALVELVRQGIERLLVIKLKSYAEMDLADLLRFHCESRNPVTEAQDARGQLGVCLLDHLALRATGEKYEFSCAQTGSGRAPYQFRGYAKRILSARERQELVGDALTGACAMRPLGTQIREHVWIGEDVTLASSARIVGPTYIGARTVVRAGATIGPFASVERDCVVDCGTTVDRSTVLPHTYLAPGILIRHGLVDGGHLEDLDRGVVADLQPAGLGSRIQQRESRRQASSQTATDVRSWAGSASTWDFPSSSTASQPWLQMQL